MTDSLTSARLKLDRAYEHLMTVHREIEAFFELQPYRFTRERGLDGTDYIIRANVVQEPPELLPLIIGDCLQNMRSALDHLAWALAKAKVGGEPPRHTAFPIYLTSDVFHERTKTGKLSPRSGLHKIGAIRPEAQAIIEELQPYHRGEFDADTDPLWVLNELARIDRHQTLSLIGSTTRSTTYSVGRRDTSGAFVPDFGVVSSEELNFGSFEDGAQILHITFREFDPSVEVQFDATTHITLGEAGAETNVVDLLVWFHRYIRFQIVPRFERFF